MANNKSAEKRNRTNEKSRMRNSRIKSSLRTAVKRVLKALSNPSNENDSKESYKKFVKNIDKAARKGVIHKKTASRKKSRIAKKLNASAKKS